MKRSTFVSVVALVCLLALPASAALVLKMSRLRLVLGGETPGNERVACSASIWLQDAGDAIQPDTEAVQFRLALPAGVVFYSVVIPAGGLSASSDGQKFSLTESAKATSGLERFDLTRESDGTWRFNLVDRGATVASQDYSQVTVLMTVGDDSGTTGATLTRTGHTWSGN